VEFFYGGCIGCCSGGWSGVCKDGTSGPGLPMWEMYDAKMILDDEGECVGCEMDLDSLIGVDDPPSGPYPCVCVYPV